MSLILKGQSRGFHNLDAIKVCGNILTHHKENLTAVFECVDKAVLKRNIFRYQAK